MALGALAGRCLLVLACAAMASAVALEGAAVHIANSDPGAAAALAPYDARAAIAAAEAGSGQGAKVASPEVRRLTRLALRRDATLPPAIELAALQAGAAGDLAREARLFDLSAAISRRSLPTRLWLIQQSVDRGDVAGALDNFDIALRTSTAAPDRLFPVLAQAASDPNLDAPIARLLDRPADWRHAFFQYAVVDAHQGPAMAGVVGRMRDRRFLVDKKIDQSLIGELLSERQFALARAVAGVFAPETGRTLVADPRFDDPRRTYPFGWDLIQGDAVQVARGRQNGRSVLQYQVGPGGGGGAATQLLTLPPGDYRLTTTTALPVADRVSQPAWTLTCGEAGGAQLVLLDQPATVGASGAADFTVPPGCAGQWLELVVRSSDDPELTGSIREVEVTAR